MKQHTIQGGNDITLHVDETGTEAGDPILFIHGYTQSRLSWDRQTDSDLAENSGTSGTRNRSVTR
jgi:pimeloyl-ACP methyl ester carboxylesterase